jgi:ribosomal protein S27E
MTYNARILSMMCLALLVFGAAPIPLFQQASAEAWVKNDMGAPSGGGQGGNFRFVGSVVGDGDRDGATEVYFTAGRTGSVYQYTYDTAGGTWKSENLIEQGFNAGPIALGDGDDSGDRELYILGMAGPMPRPPPQGQMALHQVYHDAAGWHDIEVGTANAMSAGNEISIGDGNNDNRTEVYCTGGDGHIYMYYKVNSWNTQDIGYATPPSGQGGTSMDGVAVGDGDNDGLIEVYGSAATGWVYRFSYTGYEWVRTDVGQGDTGPSGSDMASIAIGDVNGDGRNEVYGASWNNATIYMFSYDAAAAKWNRTALASLGSKVNARSLFIGDGNSDGSKEIFVGTSNNQVYSIFYDKGTARWLSTSVGSGNGAINGVAVGSAMGISAQNEVYAACDDGHGYQFLVDRNPPNNPAVWSDTHPNPGTWYVASIVHVLWKDVGMDPSGMDGYSYVWDSSPSTLPDTVKEVEESVHDATSQALSPGKWYFHIRARDNALNWNATATHFGPICIGPAPDTTPPVISDVKVSGITDKLAVVSWSTNEPADSTVEYGTTAGYGQKVSDGSFVLYHSVTLTGLAPSTVYHFCVASSDASGNGPAKSTDGAFTTLAAPDMAPPVLSNIRASGITDRLAVVSWETDEPSDSAVDFGITSSYGESTADGKYAILHEITITGLKASTIYHFRVKSRDATGNGPSLSADLNFTTLALPDKTPPQISNIRVESITETTALVLWDTDEVADSFVEFGPNASYGQSSADKTFALHHGVALKGLTSERVYHYQVISADSSGNTGKGGDLNFRTAKTPSAPDTTPPVISGITVQGITNVKAVVLWTTDEPATSDVDYGLTTSYGLKAGDGTLTLAHSVLLENLLPSTQYHLRVKSTDASGNGPSVSTDINFTTIATPDTTAPKISGVKVTRITNSSATITWTTDEPASSAVDFGNSTAYGKRQASGSNVLSHSLVLTGLKPGTSYHFRVSSTDPSGNPASPGADATFTTLKTGTTTAVSAPFPWVWVALVLIIVLIAVAAAVVVYRRKPGSTGVRAASGRPSYYADAGGDDGVETLEMEGPGARAAPAKGAVAVGAASSVAERNAGGQQSRRPPASAPASNKHVKCPGCNTKIPLRGDGAQRIQCGNCGWSGNFKPRTPSPQGAAVAAIPPPEPAAEETPAPPRAVERPAPVRNIRCTGCGSAVPVYSTAYPVKVTCPRCGRGGLYRGPKGQGQ